jgi:hypothetical protein
MASDVIQFFLVSASTVPVGVSNVSHSFLLFWAGTIETPINEEDLKGPKRSMMEERIPLGRFGRPEDIAQPVCFMASDMARYSEFALEEDVSTYRTERETDLFYSAS